MLFEYTRKLDSQRLRDELDLKQRAVWNEQLKCSCPSCSEKRYKISRYCLYHRDRVSRIGHPTLTQPKGDAWEKLLSEGDKLIEGLSKAEREKLDVWIQAAGRRLKLPASLSLSPTKIEKGYTRKTKARIILSWLLNKRGHDWTVERIVRLCLAVELWVLRHDETSGPRDRARFAEHILGSRLTMAAHIRDRRERYQSRLVQNPSWANEPYRRVEETIQVVETASFAPSVMKAVGKIVRDIVSKEIGFGPIKDYLGNITNEQRETNNRPS
jgi:hypothetical protein